MYYSKIRRPVMYILLLFIFVLFCHVQSAPGENQGENEVLKSEEQNGKTTAATTTTTKIRCTGRYASFCAHFNRKRTDINDLAQGPDIRVDRERPDIHVGLQEGRGEGRGRGRGREGNRNDDFRGSGEGDDDLRSGYDDRRRQQLSDERQLVDVGNHRDHSPRSAQLDSAINRLRSLLGTTDLQDVDDRGEEEEKREEQQEEEEEEEEESLKRSNIGTDKSNIINETRTLLRKILNDIEGRLDA